METNTSYAKLHIFMALHAFIHSPNPKLIWKDLYDYDTRLDFFSNSSTSRLLSRYQHSTVSFLNIQYDENVPSLTHRDVKEKII